MDNVELQSISLSTIREYEDDMSKAKASGQSFTDAVRNTKAARKRVKQNGSSDDDEEEEVVPARPVPIINNEILRRGLHIFGKWPKQFIMELFEFCDQTVQFESLRALEAEGLYEVMEFCFDLRCLGEKKDKIACTNKRTLFHNLKSVYQSLGDRLQHVVVDMEKNKPIWDFVEHIRIEEVNRNTLTMYYIAPGADAGTCAELMFDKDDKGPWKLYKQWSIHTAEVQSYSHIYFVATVFPKATRLIKRRISEDANASVKVSAEEQQDMKKQKKTKEIEKKKKGIVNVKGGTLVSAEQKRVLRRVASDGSGASCASGAPGKGRSKGRQTKAAAKAETYSITKTEEGK